MAKVFDIVPGEDLDYPVDWSDFLDPISDTIVSVAWTVPDGLTSVSETNTSTAANIFVACATDATVGTQFELVCTITTASSPPRERSFSRFIKVVARKTKVAAAA